MRLNYFKELKNVFFQDEPNDKAHVIINTNLVLKLRAFEKLLPHNFLVLFLSRPSFEHHTQQKLSAPSSPHHHPRQWIWVLLPYNQRHKSYMHTFLCWGRSHRIKGMAYLGIVMARQRYNLMLSTYIFLYIWVIYETLPTCAEPRSNRFPAKIPLTKFFIRLASSSIASFRRTTSSNKDIAFAFSSS